MTNSERYIHHLHAGYESGLNHFVRMHGKSLRFFAFNLVRKKEVAEEIVSDVFFKLWNRRTRFPDAHKVKAFLYIATRNACYDYLGSPKNRVQYEVDVADELEHPQPDLLAQIIQTELVELIYTETSKLPEKQAAVFRMSYFEGMTTEEISEALGISANAIFLARSRATARLRAVFKDKQLVWFLAFLYVAHIEPFVN